MRARLGLALTLLSLACASDGGETAAAPEDGPAAVGVSEQEFERGKRFLPLASRFGLTEYVHASPGAGGSTLYEYLPEGEELETWRHLGSLLLTKVADSWEEGARALPGYRDSFLRTLPVVHEAVHSPGATGGASYIRYEAGSGPSLEHALSVVWQAERGTMGTFQVLQREEPFSERQIAEFRRAVSELARAKAPRSQDRELQAKVLTLLWRNACLGHLGDYAAQSAWARRRGLRPATDAFAATALKGAEGEAWLASDQTGDYVVLLTKPHQCAVWARRASDEVVNASFERIVNGMERDGLELEREYDRAIDGAKGHRYRQIVYFAQGAASPTGFLFIASTTPSEDAGFQAQLTVGRARRGPSEE